MSDSIHRKPSPLTEDIFKKPSPIDIPEPMPQPGGIAQQFAPPGQVVYPQQAPPGTLGMHQVPVTGQTQAQMHRAIMDLQARVMQLEQQLDSRAVAAVEKHCEQTAMGLAGAGCDPMVHLCALVTVGVLRNLISAGRPWEPSMYPVIHDQMIKLFEPGGELEGFMRSRILSWLPPAGAKPHS